MDNHQKSNKHPLDDAYKMDFDPSFFKDVESQVDAYNQKERRRRWIPYFIFSAALIVLSLAYFAIADNLEDTPINGLEPVLETKTHAVKTIPESEKEIIEAVEREQQHAENNAITESTTKFTIKKKEKNTVHNNENSDKLKISPMAISQKLQPADPTRKTNELISISEAASSNQKEKRSIVLKPKHQFELIGHVERIETIDKLASLDMQPLDASRKAKWIRKPVQKKPILQFGIGGQIASQASYKLEGKTFNASSLGVLGKIVWPNGIALAAQANYQLLRPGEMIIARKDAIDYSFGYVRETNGLVAQWLHMATLPIDLRYGISKFELGIGIQPAYLLALHGEGRRYDEVAQANDTGVLDPLDDHIVYASGLLDKGDLNNIQLASYLQLAYKLGNGLQFNFRSNYNFIKPSSSIKEKDWKAYGWSIGFEYLFYTKNY